MQYLLTKEEYSELQKRASEAAKHAVTLTQEFCTLVADTMPIKFWDNKEPQAWGCILTVRKESGGNDWYCDECPAQEFCPYLYKSWSQ